MRKDKKQQKKKEDAQLEIEFRQATDSPAEATTSLTGKESSTGVELLSRLTKQRTLTENLLKEIVDYGNLGRAFKQVQRNGGSSGVDGY